MERIDFGSNKETSTKWYQSPFMLLLLGAFIGFVNGFWGGGGGMICVPILTFILGLPDKKAHATTIFIMLPLCIASFVIYLIRGFIDFGASWYIVVMFAFGGLLGACCLQKINNNVLRVIFSFVIIAGGIKLIW